MYTIYTLQEKIRIYNWYSSGFSLRQVRDYFSVEYPERPIPSLTTISKIAAKFKSTGCLQTSHQRSGVRGPYKINENKRLDVITSVVENSSTNSRSLANVHSISQSSVLRILRKEKFRSYKFQNHQELKEGDPALRAEFCEIFLDKINENPNILHKICFTDEATFTVHGEVNSQNCRYWAQENMHLYNATRTQSPQKVNTWAGIIAGHIIGPFFIEGNLNGDRYLELLRERIFPAITQLGIEEIWFQQDGAPPHNTRAVTELLNQRFPRRWIGKNGPFKWPPRSPDLTPLDFFYWGYMKSKVYTEQPIADLDSLKERVQQTSREIPQNFIENSLREFYDRLSHCLIQNGGIFEHLI